MYIYVCEDLDERSLEFLKECHIHCAIVDLSVFLTIARPRIQSMYLLSVLFNIYVIHIYIYVFIYIHCIAFEQTSIQMSSFRQQFYILIFSLSS